jgi:hypothetical protein
MKCERSHFEFFGVILKKGLLLTAVLVPFREWPKTFASWTRESSSQRRLVRSLFERN